MKGQWGLQAKMTASYVAMTAGAVLVAAVVLIVTAAFSVSGLASTQQLLGGVTGTATELAGKLAAGIASGHPQSPDIGDGSPAPGQAQLSGGGVVIPRTSDPVCAPAPASFAVAVTLARPRTVLATSYPACFPAGGHDTAYGAGVPDKLIDAASADTPQQAAMPGSGTDPAFIWATVPIRRVGGPKQGPSQTVGIVYVQVPAVGKLSGGLSLPFPLIVAGAVALLLSVPVGLAFGLLSTRRLILRMRRLAASTLAVADGQFGPPIPVSGGDEVAQVEENFNRMAARLSASLDAERRLAAANARHHERSRIARELHDSISQELFSLSVLSGGLRRALPAGSPVLPAVETMERTAGATMREMQALLLELRPVALGDSGLRGALDGIALAHRERLGVDVRAELDDVVLPAATEHGVLRVAQEALGNAVKHGDAGTIWLRLLARGAVVALEVTDDGAGFDTGAPAAGLGLQAMRDRVTELGGELDIRSSPGAGTTVRASFARGGAS